MLYLYYDVSTISDTSTLISMYIVILSIYHRDYYILCIVLDPNPRIQVTILK